MKRHLIRIAAILMVVGLLAFTAPPVFAEGRSRGYGQKANLFRNIVSPKPDDLVVLANPKWSGAGCQSPMKSWIFMLGGRWGAHTPRTYGAGPIPPLKRRHRGLEKKTNACGRS